MNKSLNKGLAYCLVGLLIVSGGCEMSKSIEEKLSINITNRAKIRETGRNISADGKKGVFDADVKGNKEIFLKNLETEQVINISNCPAKDYLPRLSTDGKKVTFLSDRTGKTEIYMVNLADLFYMKGLRSKKDRNAEAAVLHFKQAVDTDLLHIPSHHQLGCIYDKRKDYDKAIEEFSIVADLYTRELLEFLAEEVKEQ